MKELFQDVLKMNEVRGLLFLSPKGEILFSHFVQKNQSDPESIDWLPHLVEQLGSVHEAEFLFDWARLYIRHSRNGALLIWAKLNANMAMIRLNCDVSLSNWEQSGQRVVQENRRGGLFRRKRSS
jgi:hypothetical protein